MKRLLVIICVSMFILQYASSQEEKIFKEKATHNTYILDKSRRIFLVRNEQSKYFHMDPNYNREARTLPVPKFTLVNKEGLMKAMSKYIAPYLKEENLTLGNNFYFYFSFNLKGEIEEVYFAYPEEVEIPIESIEQLEAFIIKNCSMQFKANAVLDGMNYIPDIKDFPLKEIYEYENGTK